MASALTELAVKKASKCAARYEIPDGKTAGLYLVVFPSGAKSWAFRYRRLDGKPAKVTLGKLSDAFGLTEARKDAAKQARLREELRDPAAERREAKARARDTSDLVGAWLDKFIEKHVRKENRPRTAEEVERIIKLHIRPVWADRKIGDITSDDVHDLIERVEKPIAKNRTLAVVKKFFSWVMAQKRSPVRVSPAGTIERPTTESARDRVLKDDEIRYLWRATEATGHLAVMMRLLLLTGQRRTEVSAMRWSELELDGAKPLWTLPKERTKNGEQHEVPLVPAAVDILRGVGRSGDSNYVLTTTGESPVSGFSNFKEALDRRMLAEARRDDPKATIAPWRLHDLRRTVSTMMADRLDIAPHVIETLLNHKTGHRAGVAGVYNLAKYRLKVRAALNAWADYVAALVTGDTAGSNVVQLRVG